MTNIRNENMLLLLLEVKQMVFMFFVFNHTFCSVVNNTLCLLCYYNMVMTHKIYTAGLQQLYSKVLR